MELLKKLVFDDGKIVTKQLLMRQSLLSMHEAEIALNEFYDKNSDLSAVFLVYGIKEDMVRQSIMCSKDLLEKAKEGFVKVISTTIYSLHQNSSTTIHALLNTDYSGKYEAPKTPYDNRIHIVSPSTMEAIKTWKRRNPKPVYSTFEIPEFIPKIKRKSKDWLKTIVVKSNQHNLNDAFAYLVNKIEAKEKMEVDVAASSSKNRLQVETENPAVHKPYKKSSNNNVKSKVAVKKQKTTTEKPTEHKPDKKTTNNNVKSKTVIKKPTTKKQSESNKPSKKTANRKGGQMLLTSFFNKK